MRVTKLHYGDSCVACLVYKDKYLSCVFVQVLQHRDYIMGIYQGTERQACTDASPD